MISDTGKCAITFYVNNERHAYRSWPYVPRLGEEIMMFDGKRGNGRKHPFVVSRVVWGVGDMEDSDSGMQAVNVELERI